MRRAKPQMNEANRYRNLTAADYSEGDYSCTRVRPGVRPRRQRMIHRYHTEFHHYCNLRKIFTNERVTEPTPPTAPPVPKKTVVKTRSIAPPTRHESSPLVPCNRLTPYADHVAAAAAAAGVSAVLERSEGEYPMGSLDSYSSRINFPS